jgi:hypothetical protein
VRLDLEPDAEARLRIPDRGHLGAGVTRNHAGLGYFLSCPGMTIWMGLNRSRLVS